MECSGRPDVPIRVVLLGKDRAVTRRGLLYLLDRGVDVVAVVAPLDGDGRPTGALGQEASKRGIRVDSLQEVARDVESQTLGVDLALSLLYWNKIGPPLIKRPRLGCINFHPAPLPDFRGVAGYSFGILEDVKEWGVSAHFIDLSIDTGDIITVRRFPIDASKETARSLERQTRAPLLGVFEEVVDLVAGGEELPRSPQGSGRYFSMSDLEEARRIRPEDTPDTVDRKIRAFWYPPHPGARIEHLGRAYTLANEQVLLETAMAYDALEQSSHHQHSDND